MARRPNRGRLTFKLQEPRTRYLPAKRIAVGGMAEVWRGEAVMETGERYPVAIKRVRPELATQNLYHSMFEDEARIGMLLRHPNIVRVYDARDIGGTYIMIMELVDGPALQSLLASAQKRHMGMPVHAAAYVVREIARALDYAHNARGASGHSLGIIHRDVSPHNVLLGRNGAVKLLDFGLSDASVNQTVTSPSVAGGKLGYLAPEVLEQKPPGGSIDVFAAGVVLWEALAGRRLFMGESDQETVRNVLRCDVKKASYVNASVPPELDALIARLVTRDPSQRVPSAAVLADELDRFLRDHYPDVGPKDVALLASMHSASAEAIPSPPPEMVRRITEELETFAIYAEEDGASAIDVFRDS